MVIFKRWSYTNRLFKKYRSICQSTTIKHYWNVYMVGTKIWWTYQEAFIWYVVKNVVFIRRSWFHNTSKGEYDHKLVLREILWTTTYWNKRKQEESEKNKEKRQLLETLSHTAYRCYIRRILLDLNNKNHNNNNKLKIKIIKSIIIDSTIA